MKAAAKNGLTVFFQGHQSRRGAYSALISAVAIALVIVLNLAVGLLPTTVTQKDITDNHLYQVSDTSKSYLAALDTDVAIHVLAKESDVDARIVKFISVYAALSGHLSVEYIDPVAHPAALTAYDASANTIVVDCAATGRQETVAISDIIGYDSYSYYTTGTYTENSFDCEGRLTSAVDAVVSAVTHKVYTTAGHGEASLSDSLTKLLTRSHLDVESVNLLQSGSVPSDCDALICCAPTADLADDELTMLRTYLSGGGHVLYLMSSELLSLPNWETLLGENGLAVTSGYIADTKSYYSNNPYAIFPAIATGSGVAGDLSSSDNMLVYSSRGLLTAEVSGVTVTPFLTTTDGGYNVDTDGSKTAGTYVLAATAVSTAGGRLTVYGSDSVISSQITDSFTNLANLRQFVSAVTADMKNVSQISVEAVSLTSARNTVPAAGTWSLLFAVILPLGTLIWGLIRSRQRRRL